MSPRGGVRAFEDLCADIRDFARQNGDARKISVSDTIVYGAGMEAMIAMAKLRALSDYAKRELRVELFIHNGAPDMQAVPAAGSSNGTRDR